MTPPPPPAPCISSDTFYNKELLLDGEVVAFGILIGFSFYSGFRVESFLLDPDDDLFLLMWEVGDFLDSLLRF